VTRPVPGPIAIIADDEDLGRLLLAESAAAAGLSPLVFDNGADAVEAALAREAAIVLLDVEMPQLDGFSACRLIRTAKDQSTLPIVMVTGLDDKSAVNTAFEAGATDFISKPVNWSLLPHRLAYILRNATLVRTLADREAKMSTLVAAIPDALWVVSPKGELRWSQNTRTLAVASSEVPVEASSGLAAAMPHARLADILIAIEQTANDGQLRVLELRDSSSAELYRSAELRLSRCAGGDVLVVRQDTSERTNAAQRIERLAFYDGLTGLPNRQHCIQIATQYLREACEKTDRIAFLYVDLNSFKRINDTFGHSVGDNILQKVASVLAAVLAPFTSIDAGAFLARLGGDEFVVLVRHTDALQTALQIAEQACIALETPLTFGTLEFIATPSIGIAVYPDDGKDVETLLKHADTAMYQAKESGGPRVVTYTAAMSARLRNSLELETRLRRALRDDALGIRFQPKFRLLDGALVGAEALVRWCDTELGEIPPSRFIPVAEESGLIVDIGAWIIRAVCEQLREWCDRGVAVPVAINVSGKELLFADPARSIAAEAEKAGILASMIEAEITESVFVTDSRAGRNNVEKIRQLGCQIALDDFGTGYSSLSYLTRFPPHRVKIDRSFIQDVDLSANNAAIVKAIMSLAKSLNLKVTAEGVERQGQLDWLKIHGCDEAQGFLLAKPMTALDIERQFLRNEISTQFTAYKLNRA
jgi:diguanylate cyclase (GGDEF)-like protein